MTDLVYGRACFVITEEVYNFLMLDDMAFCEENEVVVDSASNIHSTGIAEYTAQMDYLALLALAGALGEITIKPKDTEYMHLSTPRRQNVAINPILLFDGDQ